MGLLKWLRRDERQSPENPSTSLANPATWLVHFMGGGEPVSSGVSVNEENAIGVSAVYSAVRIIAETIASLPLQVFRRTEDGNVLAREHPMYRLLHDEPNELQTSFYFRETLTAHQALWGNAYAIIDRRAGLPFELLPVRPDRVEPELVDRRLSYLVTGDDGRKQRFRPEDVLHFPALGFDGVSGKSPIRLHREAIGLAKATERFGAQFFGKGAHVSGLLKHPNTFSSNDVSQRIKQQFTETYGGLDNSFKVAVLEEGMEFQSLSMPNDDAQFLETRKMQVLEVARIFRLPPHMLGELDRAIQSNIEQQALEFVVHSIRPWLVRQEQEYNRKLFTERERREFFAEYNLDGLLRGDSEMRSKFYREMFMIGAMSPNDVRAKENLNPVEGGDRYYVPLNMVPTDRVDDELEEDGPPEDENDIRARVLSEAARSVLKREITRLQRNIPLLERHMVSNFRSGIERVYADVATLYTRKMAGAITALRDGGPLSPEEARHLTESRAAWLAESRASIDALEFPGDGDWRGAFEQLFTDWQTRPARAGRELAAALASEDVDV